MEKDLSIRLHEKSLGKSASAFPTEYKVTPAPKSSEKWFSWERRWHPVSLCDKEGNLVLRPEILIQLTVSQEGELKHLFEAHSTPPVAPMKNIYWFQAVRPHFNGTVSLEFSSPSHPTIKPLIVNIPAVGGMNLEDTSPAETLVNENENPGDGFSELQSPQAASPRTQNKRSLTQPKEQPERKKERSMINAKESEIEVKEELETAEEEVSTDEEDEDDVSDEKRKFPPYPREVRYQEYPLKTALLPVKSRLNRPALPLAIHGPEVQALLPPSLVVALLDDKSRVETLWNHGDSFMEDIWQPDTPTVCDILMHVHSRCDQLVAESTPLLNDLRLCFDLMVESVFYPCEKKSLGRRVQSMLKSRISPSTRFGPIYLLRYIVMLLVNLHEPGTCEDASFGNSSTSGSGKSNGHSSSNRDNEGEQASSSKSAIRRSSIGQSSAHKQFKASAAKLKTIIGVILSDLDANAHFLF